MRNNRVDVLRFIGLAMIIFAHVGPPALLFQLRNFDVPLMVLVSGMSFGLSHKANQPYLGYLWKRIKRLVFPVWVFLTIYFVAQFVVYPESPELNFETILASYMFDSGIGYVWIIKVFLLVAFISPFLFVFNKNIYSDKKYYIILAGLIILYELMRYLSLPYIQDGFGKFLSRVIFYIIPYGIVFSIGLRMMWMGKKELYLLSIFNLGILIIFGFWLLIYYGELVPTQALKYPPSIYYLSYALFVSSLLWLHSNCFCYVFEKFKIEQIVLFVANNSIWIYLWHIPLVKAIYTNFLLKYMLVFAIAASITYVQVFIVNNLLKKFIRNDSAVKNMKVLFTG